MSNVVRILRPLHTDKFSTSCGGNKNTPVMLQTTAAVHPGASGGAVVNSEGLMVGLVTRYIVFVMVLKLTPAALHTNGILPYMFLSWYLS